MSSESDKTFSDMPVAPPDAIFGLLGDYHADTNQDKINLSVGAYRTAEGEPWVLPSVRIAEKRMLAKDIHKEYLPIDGLPALREVAMNLAYGKDCDAWKKGRIAVAQSISGTGALRLAAELLKKRPVLQKSKDTKPVALVSDPTWGNHRKIFAAAGYDVKIYRYYDAENRGVDIEGFIEDLKNAPRDAVVVLQACAHNPTGYDLYDDQWGLVIKTVREAGLFPLFDMAYQGFASGDPDHDARALRRYVASGASLGLCQSFAKNFGLYGERVGTVSFVTGSKAEAAAVQSQLKAIIRPMYSNPPKHGAHIVSEILGDEELKVMWCKEIQTMSTRIRDMRAALHQALKENGTPGNWDHIVKQIGMFSYLGITKDQARQLRSKHHIYLTDQGRISMCGLNADRAKILADALRDVLNKKARM